MAHEYPKQINFKTVKPDGFSQSAREWLERLNNEVKMTMLAENILQIEYPPDIITNIRTVNVDDCIYRLDFIAPDDRFWLCKCVFPNVPWNNKVFMTSRWHLGRRIEINGLLTLTYPSNDEHRSC